MTRARRSPGYWQDEGGWSAERLGLDFTMIDIPVYQTARRELRKAAGCQRSLVLDGIRFELFTVLLKDVMHVCPTSSEGLVLNERVGHRGPEQR